MEILINEKTKKELQDITSKINAQTALRDAILRCVIIDLGIDGAWEINEDFSKLTRVDKKDD